jgi:hypothetical protein
MSEARWSDRRMVLWMGAVMLVLIVAISILSPTGADEDPQPTTYNTGPQGAKAAFMTLDAIGRESTRWTRPISVLGSVDASKTTLVLAAPVYLPTERDAIAAAVKQFLERGGRVLTTGPTGALLLPDGSVGPPTVFMTDLCHTAPADGPLAAAGSVTIVDRGAWAGKAKAEIAHRCGQDGVVVRMKVGSGEAVWWSSASPLTNAELKTDADLKLLLLSVGEGRAVVWDESLHAAVPGLWSAARGIPLGWLVAQVALLGLLLVLSFSRRNGPLRAPVMVPRSSPVEFAWSMGDLYEKARASNAAVDAARRRLLRAVVREAGVSQTDVEAGPQAIVHALGERLGGDWSAVGIHLERCAELAHESVTMREALAMTRAMSADAERIRAAARGTRTRGAGRVRVA